MKKIRILQFPVANSQGGITQYVLRNWEFIDRSKFRFDFATMSRSLDFAEKLERDGCKIHYISCYAEDNREKFIEEFTKILREGNYDVVHLHTKQWKSFLVEQIAKEANIKKIIIHAHNTGVDVIDEKRRFIETQVHNQMLAQLTEDVATDYWACSWEAAQFLFGDRIPRQKIKIMYNAIDLEKYKFNPQIREKYRMDLGIAENECVIGHVGRMAYSKNQEFLIQVFAEVCKISNSKYKLLLVGGGECEEEYRKMVLSLGLSEQVIFTGLRNDVAELLQAMDIFCMPSRVEGLGIALIEAQASGLLCLASSQVPKIAITSKNAYLLPLMIPVWKEKIIENTHLRDVRKVLQLETSNYDITEQIKVIEDEYTKIEDI